eukprot:2670635-Alexandrium_andersonii.AAC.1
MAPGSRDPVLDMKHMFLGLGMTAIRQSVRAPHRATIRSLYQPRPIPARFLRLPGELPTPGHPAAPWGATAPPGPSPKSASGILEGGVRGAAAPRAGAGNAQEAATLLFRGGFDRGSTGARRKACSEGGVHSPVSPRNGKDSYGASLFSGGPQGTTTKG